MLIDQDPIRVLSASDYDSFQRLNQVRFRLAGFDVTQILAPKITPQGLVEEGKIYSPKNYEAIFYQFDIPDLGRVTEKAWELREITDGPIIIAVNNVGLVRERIRKGIVNEVVGIPDTNDKFEGLVEDINREAMKRRVALARVAA